MQDLDQVLRGFGFARIHPGILAQDVKPNLAFHDLDQQAVHGATAGGDLLENVRAFLFFLDGLADALELPLYAVHPDQQSFFFMRGVGQGDFPPLTYYTQYSTKERREIFY
jgi:hypothetical protein